MGSAQRLILPPVALVDRDGAVAAAAAELVVRHVPDAAPPAAGVDGVAARDPVGPDLEAGAVGRVGHGGVVHVQVLDHVDLPVVLAQGADRDAVRAGAGEVLDHDRGGVGLEGHAVVGVLDDRVLHDDVGAAERVEAVGVFDLDVGDAAAGVEVQVGQDDVGAVVV